MNRFIAACVSLGILVAGCGKVQLPTPGAVTDMQVRTGNAVVGPRLEVGADGKLRLSWMERLDEGATLKFVTLADGGWGATEDVVTDARMFVNWADLSSVNALPDGTLVASWLRYSAPQTYSYDVMLAYSGDGGSTWTEPVAAHDDGTPTEHGFVSISGTDDGAALLWLDGRDTGNPPSGNVLDSSMTLRAARISPDGVRSGEQLVDDSVCDCCQTDVAVAAAGPIAVYRNRTGDEIRDVYVTRFENGRWQAGTALHEDRWKISACPVNGPAIAADGEFVAVAWFTAANQRPLVQLKFSTDGGRTFGPPLEVAAGENKGRVGVGLVGEDLVAVSWVENGPDDSDLVMLRLVTRDGRPGPAVTIGSSKLLRMFPQLASTGDALVAAWTDADGDGTRLVVRRVAVGP